MLEGMTLKVQVPRIVEVPQDSVIDIAGVGDDATNYFTDSNFRATNCCSCDKE